MKITIFSIFAVIICLSGCSSKSNSSRKPVTNIIITPSNKSVTYGNDFTITIETKSKINELNYIELYINNHLLKKTNQSNFSITVSSDTLLPGDYLIKTIAQNNEGKNGINYNTIKVLSNIEPLYLGFNLIETIPHNTKYFTQGLEFNNGNLYESTGDYGTSFIYVYKNDNISIQNSLKIDDQYFGEGITILNNKIYQLTYKSKVGFIYDLISFKKIGEFNFSSKEGWGLTNDGKYLIMSDGTSTINFIDPTNFNIEKSIQVSLPNGFINNINELEFVDGFIFANIWTTDKIIKIEAKTGRVIAFYDLASLKSSLKNYPIDVLNGIAFNEKENLFYITGKLWPKIFKIKLSSK